MTYVLGDRYFLKAKRDCIETERYKFCLSKDGTTNKILPSLMDGNLRQTSNGWQFSQLAGGDHTLVSCMWTTNPLILFRLKALYLFYTIILYFLEAFWKWICFLCSCLRKPSRKKKSDYISTLSFLKSNDFLFSIWNLRRLKVPVVPGSSRPFF